MYKNAIEEITRLGEDINEKDEIINILQDDKKNQAEKDTLVTKLIDQKMKENIKDKLMFANFKVHSN